MSDDRQPTMVWIDERRDAEGRAIVRKAHWRRQKPALTPEQKRDRKRQQLVEQAKAEQRDEGLL
jgi:hypothetical protein